VVVLTGTGDAFSAGADLTGDHPEQKYDAGSVDFVEELPRNPSGKLLKRVLRAPYWADAEGRQIG
jgi:enoyl-CoA hydratase/carnithine racemase